jgi:hypothetical protein
MKSIFMTFICLIIVNVICFPVGDVVAASESVIWQQELTSDPNLKCKPVAMSVDNKNNELIILGTSESSGIRETDLQLWKIDPNGTVKTRKSLGLLSEYNLLIAQAVSGIKVAVKPYTGDIVRLKLDDVNNTSLSVVSRNMQASEVKLNTPTPKVPGTLILRDMISCQNDRSLFVGQDEDGGVVMKTDLAGNMVWKKSFIDTGKSDDTKKTDILNSLASDPQGSSFYVAGLSATTASKMSFAKAATVCLLRYDNEGKIIASDFFEGGLAPWPSSFPKVICLPSGTVLVVYDKSKNGIATELYAKAYTKDLTPLWEKPILQTKENGPSAYFDICATTKDRFVIAGQVNFSDLRVYECGANGTILQTLELDGEIGSGGIYVDYLDGKILVAYAAKTQENEKEAKIKLMALKSYKTN